MHIHFPIGTRPHLGPKGGGMCLKCPPPLNPPMIATMRSLSLHLEDTIVANSPRISIDVTTTSYVCITTFSLLFHEPQQQSWDTKKHH